MKKRGQLTIPALVTGALYLFHTTDRLCPSESSLWGVFDKDTHGIISLESSSRDLQEFRFWHRLSRDYRYCRRASRSELRDYITNLTYYECLPRTRVYQSAHPPAYPKIP